MTTTTNASPVLTEEMVAEIRAFIPRYPSLQAVTLPALHVVNEHLRHVPLQAVVEIAELLELAPAQVQDTLTFYGFFKQDAAAWSDPGLGVPFGKLRTPRRRGSAGADVPAIGYSSR